MTDRTTWRERIAAARERGYFTRDDYRRSLNARTCAWGEQVARGLVNLEMERQWWQRRPLMKFVDIHIEAQGACFSAAVRLDEFDHAEHWLDVIEDRAMQLKREGAR